jgi:hypothetical protein
MWFLSIAKQIRRETFLAGTEYSVLFLGVDQQIPVLGADGAVAGIYLAASNVGQVNGEFDLATVTVGGVRLEGRSHLVSMVERIKKSRGWKLSHKKNPLMGKKGSCEAIFRNLTSEWWSCDLRNQSGMAFYVKGGAASTTGA